MKNSGKKFNVLKTAIELLIHQSIEGNFLGKLTLSGKQPGFTVRLINDIVMILTKIIKYRSILIARDKVSNVFCQHPEIVSNSHLITITGPSMLPCLIIRNH